VIFLLCVTALVLGLGFVIMKPFLKPMLFALVIAIVFYPLHARVKRWVRNANAAAFLSTFLVFFATVVAAVIVGRALARELTGLYLSLSGKGPEGGTLRLFQVGERWINQIIQRLGLVNFDIRGAIEGHLEQGTTWMLQQVASFIGNLTGALLGVAVAAVVLFFLFREGDSLRRGLASMIPLAVDRVERLFGGVQDVVVASVYGILAIGALQGLLMGVAFWVLGLPSPVLWGLTTVFLSVIPVVGTGGVLVPAVIILWTGGHWAKALILTAWGVAIIHPVDNVLRPCFVGQRARLSAIYLFFAILGGVQAFGLIGLLVGPVVLSIALVLFDILKEETHGGKAKGSTESAAPTREGPLPVVLPVEVRRAVAGATGCASNL